MLFLLNNKVIEIDSPEAWVMSRWRDLGCGDPRQLRAQDAVEFAKQHFLSLGEDAPDEALKDIAALIVSKTGANSLIFKPTASGDLDPHLRNVPPLVLETYQRGAANDQDQRARA